MVHFGTTELIIILVIIILLFGVGRISKVAKEMGKGVREFRSGIMGKDENGDQEPSDETKQAENTKTE
jgi:sec-independent protein translocase protein TatA